MTTSVSTPVLYGFTETPIGRVRLASSDGALVGLHVDGHAHTPAVGGDWQDDRGELDDVREQLAEYFDGDRRAFDLDVRPAGTDFQRDVWAALQRIPYGQTRSYGEIADSIGRPSAVRAVGAANGQNPVSIVIPCHRVIGADGSLTGYGWGVERKSWLLDHEQGRAATTPRLFDLAAG